jgi:hypothetical protein
MKFKNFNVPTIFLNFNKRKLKLGRLADSGDELYNVVSNAAY